MQESWNYCDQSELQKGTAGLTDCHFEELNYLPYGQDLESSHSETLGKTSIDAGSLMTAVMHLQRQDRFLFLGGFPPHLQNGWSESNSKETVLRNDDNISVLAQPLHSLSGLRT
jgi:hypothetical protein